MKRMLLLLSVVLIAGCAHQTTPAGPSTSAGATIEYAAGNGYFNRRCAGRPVRRQ
jgi:hypothetical protein